VDREKSIPAPKTARRNRVLAYSYPGAAERFHDEGMPCLAKLTETMSSRCRMQAILAVGSDTLLSWLIGDAKPKARHEQIARLYLETNMPRAVPPEPAPAPALTATPTATATPGIVLLVTAPIGTENKVCGVLRMLGCETQIL
jgi:hypothetical protein